MAISNYERQYMSILKEIYEHGYSDGVNERTGYATKRLPNKVIEVDLENEFPILKSKKVQVRTALKEILWIWQCQSNNIHDLDAHIWDEWADHNGSIGAAYGAQIRKPVSIYTDPVHKTPESFRAYENQCQYILEYLREFPNGRWGNATLWNVDDLAKMNLVPCCHTVTWNLDGGRLNCLLDQRSGDFPKGVPFNTTQYAMLTYLFARDLGVRPGSLLHVISDAHIYDNQMEGVEEQLANWDLLEAMDYNPNACVTMECKAGIAADLHNKRVASDKAKCPEQIIKDAEMALKCTPLFTVNSDAPKGFFDLCGEECHIIDYVSMGAIDFGKTAV